MGTDLFADDPVSFRCFNVDIIQADTAAQIRVHGQVCHEPPGPAPGAAADIGDRQFLRVMHQMIPPIRQKVPGESGNR